MSERTIYLSLGSNVGDREKNLRRGIGMFGENRIEVVKISRVYETEPRGVVEQPWFLNLVVEARTGLFPRQLLGRIQRIEQALGRRRRVEKGPRTLDIDILFFGRAVVDAPGLRIPHARLAERRFVLEPLAELAPELRHPETRRTVREMLAAVAGQAVKRGRALDLNRDADLPE